MLISISLPNLPLHAAFHLGSRVESYLKFCLANCPNFPSPLVLQKDTNYSSSLHSADIIPSCRAVQLTHPVDGILSYLIVFSLVSTQEASN